MIELELGRFGKACIEESHPPNLRGWLLSIPLAGSEQFHRAVPITCRLLIVLLEAHYLPYGTAGHQQVILC